MTQQQRAHSYGSLNDLHLNDNNNNDDHEKYYEIRPLLNNEEETLTSIKESSSTRTATATATAPTASDPTATTTTTPLEDIPLPLKLAPLLKRLTDSDDDLSDNDILSILFVIRIADAMHRCSYATFLTRSFVDELTFKLGIEELDLEIETTALRWSFNQGEWMTYHRIPIDYDGSAMQQLSKIALCVIDSTMTVDQALRSITKMEEATYVGVESMIRDFPGRIIILPTLAMTGSVVYFHGTWTDMVCCFFTGLTAGIIHYLCSIQFPQWAGVQDLLVSISTSLIATLSLVIFPNSTCFSAQILGTLFWFLYGISFMLSIYEMTQSLVVTGLTRFAEAVLNSFILAFGVVIGVWIAFYGGPNRFDRILDICDDNHLEYIVDPIYFPILKLLVAIGALMQMRVAPKFWLICLITQLVAVHTQYYLDEILHQPLFVFNFLPAYMATITAHYLIVIFHWLKWTQLVVINNKKRPTTTTTTHRRNTSLPVRGLTRADNGTLHPLGDGSSGTSSSSSFKHARAQRMSQSLRFIDQTSSWSEGIGASTTSSSNGGNGVGNRFRKQHHRSKSMKNIMERSVITEREKRVHYQRSDLWFCLVPALYLLVPGSSVWKFAFFSIIDAAFGEGHTAALNENNFSLQSMISGVFVVAIGQTLGVRLALVSLSAVTTIWSTLLPSSSPSSTSNATPSTPSTPLRFRH